jgi:hypothetical protein
VKKKDDDIGKKPLLSTTLYSQRKQQDKRKRIEPGRKKT